MVPGGVLLHQVRRLYGGRHNGVVGPFPSLLVMMSKGADGRRNSICDGGKAVVLFTAGMGDILSVSSLDARSWVRTCET